MAVNKAAKPRYPPLAGCRGWGDTNPKEYPQFIFTQSKTDVTIPDTRKTGLYLGILNNKVLPSLRVTPMAW
jgi:hypothetical protein